MKVTSVRFEKLANLGNYENEKIGIEVLLDDGDLPQEALQRARTFVSRSITGNEDEDKHERDRYKRLSEKMQADPDSYTPRQLREAQEWLEQHPEPGPIEF